MYSSLYRTYFIGFLFWRLVNSMHVHNIRENLIFKYCFTNAGGNLGAAMFSLLSAELIILNTFLKLIWIKVGVIARQSVRPWLDSWQKYNTYYTWVRYAAYVKFYGFLISKHCISIFKSSTEKRFSLQK